MKKLKEPFKTALIALLILSMGALFFQTWLYDTTPLGGGSAAAAPSLQPSRADSYGMAASPASVVVRSEGIAYASAVGAADARVMLGRLAPLITDSISGAQSAALTTRDRFREALRDGAVVVYVRFAARQPVRLLALAHGADYDGGGLWADRVAVTVPEDGGASVWFCDGDEYYVANTTATPSPDAAQLAAYVCGRDAQFTFEQSGFESLRGELFAASGLPTVPTAVPSAPPAADATAYLAIFNMNPQTIYRYTTADGTQIALDDTKTLSVAASGRVTFSDSAVATGERTDVVSAIERCRRTAAAALGQSGDTELVLSSVTENGNNTVVSFSYSVFGLRVYGDGGVMSFELEGETMKSATIELRRYIVDSAVALMPYRTAAAVGAEWFAYYADDSGALVPQWVTRNG